MRLGNLFRERDAVSPVVGVVLMVAITVLLVAFIATTVFGVAEDNLGTVPQAAFDTELEQNVTYDPPNVGTAPSTGTLDYAPYGKYKADKLTITHRSGESIDSAKLFVKMQGTQVKYINGSNALKGIGAPGSQYRRVLSFEQMEAPEQLSAGKNVTVTTIFTDVQSRSHVNRLKGASASIVYQDNSTGTSTTLRDWSGPDAS